MCHTTDFYHHRRRQDHRLIRIKSITISLSAVSTTTTLLPETLTFVFLPRMNGTLLQVDTSTFPSDSPAFISLHRRILNSTATTAVFTSHERIAFSDCAVFEVHVGENHLIHGVIRRCDAGNLKMECKCVAEREFGINEAVVVTAEENGGVMKEKVKVTLTKRRRLCRKYALVEIPEERVCDVAEEEDDEEGSGTECCCCYGEDEEGISESNGGYDSDQMMMEMEMEGVRWAVDVGIWALCIGVGLLVSKASVRSLIRKKKKILV